MLEIMDKILMLIFSTALYLHRNEVGYALIPMLIVISLSCLCTYFENSNMNRFSTIFFGVFCIFFPEFLLFLPVILYDIYMTLGWKYGLLYLFPLIIHLSTFTVYEHLWLFVLLVLSLFSKYKSTKIGSMRKEYYTFRDNTKELELALKAKNQALLKKQDYEVYTATLQERNRISKELHDNIGHLLSRSLLHIGALITLNKDERNKEELLLLHSSLSEGMDSIRSTIHHMQDESIDLYQSMDTLIKDFRLCPIHFDYNLRTSPPIHLKYFFISTVKEALNNIIKHSNADTVSISLMEHPIMYQLIIYDNGSLSEKEMQKIEEINALILTDEGLGLRNIAERVHGFEGLIRISAREGFKIFITIPIRKEQGGEKS